LETTARATFAQNIPLSDVHTIGFVLLPETEVLLEGQLSAIGWLKLTLVIRLGSRHDIEERLELGRQFASGLDATDVPNVLEQLCANKNLTMTQWVGRCVFDYVLGASQGLKGRITLPFDTLSPFRSNESVTHALKKALRLNPQ